MMVDAGMQQLLLMQLKRLLTRPLLTSSSGNWQVTKYNVIVQHPSLRLLDGAAVEALQQSTRLIIRGLWV